MAAEQKCFPRLFNIQKLYFKVSRYLWSRSSSFIDKVKKEEEFSENADRVINLIHRDDAVSAILSRLAPSTNIGRIYNVSDGNHATRGQIANWLAENLNVKNPLL